MEALKPTLANIANRAERYHTGEDDGNKRKKMAAKDPIAAKVRSSAFRWGAIEHIISTHYDMILNDETYGGLQFHP